MLISNNQLINTNNIFNNPIPFNNNINNNLILNPLIQNLNNNQNNLTNQFVNKNNINNNNPQINKIKDECYIGHAKPISESVIEKLYNSIVRIKLDNKFATGFFMKFKIKKKEMKCLFTCNHVISQNDIDKKIIIKIYYGKKGKEERREIKLDKNIRFIKTFNEDEDVTLIEIIENDNISKDKYLDLDLNYKNGYDKYENKNYYLAGYPRDYDERCISSGKIIKILDYQFFHTMETSAGSSGSPICNENGDVIGIHTSTLEDKKLNIGIFIGKIIDNLKNKNNNKNYIIAEIYINDENINKDIRIINSYEQYKRENSFIKDEYKNYNEKEIKENCLIKVNGILIPFSYFYKFKTNGKYIIEYYFNNYITNTNYMFYEC